MCGDRDASCRKNKSSTLVFFFPYPIGSFLSYLNILSFEFIFLRVFIEYVVVFILFGLRLRVDKKGGG